MAKSNIKNTIKTRNLEAMSPLMRKGGLHTADRVKVKKKRDRRNARNELRQTKWL